ncbi:FtsH protease activity modulator HflK [Burkholderiales bacterium]|jgi:modulator of FtsH protease HflK|nr:FtsH protease activity modulator HflK [Burkholderiales bacterium]MDA9993971.1 FtsH protease activity modulator HflK [Burkholderiales bacterium]MDC0500714.1 FtsH protease activity modulator HflK [Burkholderiales bacterium]
MAMNDPRWGQNNDGPPDLEELWRRFNKRIGSFGQKGNGSGGNNNSSGRLPPIGGGIVVVIALLLWAASGVYIVDASERGVVFQFGRYLETTQPGPHWHIPWPVGSKEIVNVSEVRTIEVGYRNNARNKVPNEALMLTDDENIVDLQFAVQYVRTNPEDYLFYNRDPDQAVKQMAESAIREIVGKSKMDFVLQEGREELAINARDLMQSVLDRYQTGITVSQVTMQNAQPPDQVQAAFDDAVKAKQDQERQKNEGQAYYNDVVPKAQGAAARLSQEAEAYKGRVIAAAEGEASRFESVLNEYSKAPKVTRERMYLDTMQSIFTNATKVFIDQKDNSNLLFLPLDKLIGSGITRNASSFDAGMNQVNDIESGIGVNNEENRTRNAFRVRDRETR